MEKPKIVDYCEIKNRSRVCSNDTPGIMESPQMYDNNQNSIQMAGQQTKNVNQSNNNNSHAINHNLKNDHMTNGLSNGALHLQKQIQHPQLLQQQQQQQIQQVAQYSQNDLEELGGPEISLDLANFMLVFHDVNVVEFFFINHIISETISSEASKNSLHFLTKLCRLS